MQITGMPDKGSVAALLLSTQPQGAEQMLFGSRQAAAKGAELLSFKQTLQQSQSAAGSASKEKLGSGKEAIAERTSVNTKRAEKQETVTASEPRVTEKKDAAMPPSSSATDDSSEGSQAAVSDTGEQEDEDYGTVQQTVIVMPMLFQTLNDAALTVADAASIGVLPEVSMTEATPLFTAVNDLAQDDGATEQMFNFAEALDSELFTLNQETETVEAFVDAAESAGVAETEGDTAAKVNPTNQPADFVTADAASGTATTDERVAFSRHQELRQRLSRVADTSQSENPEEPLETSNDAEGHTVVGKAQHSEQPLRAKNSGDSPANARDGAVAESTATETPWNFNQLLADQTQLFQPVLNQIQNTPSNVTVVAQIDHWLNALEAGNIQIHEGQVTEMEMTLQPRNLGKLVLKLEMENGELRAYFATQSQIVKQALESQMSSLKDLLQQQGLNVGQLSVQVGNEQRQSINFRESQSRAAGRREGNVAQSAEGIAAEMGVQRAGELWSGLPGGRLYLRI